MLIPGAYQVDDFVTETGKKATTYGFKGIERHQGPKIGHGYGDKVRYIIHNGENSTTAIPLKLQI